MTGYGRKMTESSSQQLDELANAMYQGHKILMEHKEGGDEETKAESTNVDGEERDNHFGRFLLRKLTYLDIEKTIAVLSHYAKIAPKAGTLCHKIYTAIFEAQAQMTEKDIRANLHELGYL